MGHDQGSEGHPLADARPRRADLLARGTNHVGETTLQRALDFANHFRIGLLHVGDTAHHFDLLRGRKTNEHFARLVMRQVTHDQRDGLRMLFLNEGEQVLALRLLQKRKRRLLNLRLNLLNDFICSLRIQRVFQEVARIVETAFTHIALRHRERIELADDTLSQFFRHITKRGECARDLFHRFGGHFLE